MTNNIVMFVKKHIDFGFYKITWVVLLTFISVIGMIFLMPQKYGYENGLIENVQMAILFFITYLSITSKVNKNLFSFVVLVLSILIIREVNCGRTLFFPIPGEYHKYYSWKDLPYPWIGKIVHAVYATWIAVVGILFFKRKVYIDLWNTIKNIRFPFWNLLFVIIATLMGSVAEKLTNNNFVFEEGFELLFYVSLLSIVWLYSRNENFVIKSN